MYSLILASEAVHLADAPAGDDFATMSYVLLGVTMLITAIATWIVTPKLGDH